MTGEHLDAILKVAGAKTEKDMTISRIDAVKQDGELVYARTPRRELFVVVRSDIFAAAFEGEPNAKITRRAGFG